MAAQNGPASPHQPTHNPYLAQGPVIDYRPRSRTGRWRVITLFIAGGIGCLALVAAGTVAVVRHINHRPPPDARAAGVPVVDGDTLYLVDGHHVRLPVPDGGRVTRLDIVPDGYLYVVDQRNGIKDLRLADRAGTGAYRHLAELADDDFRVTPDGSTAVVVAMDAPYRKRAAAIHLETGERWVTTATMDWPSIVDVTNGWALLLDSGNPLDKPDTVLWNLNTGDITRATDPTIAEFGLLPSGAVLRGLHVPAWGADHADPPACYGVVPVSGYGSAKLDGYCGKQVIGLTWVSPTGEWALALMADRGSGDYIAVLRLSDLEAGSWAPVGLKTEMSSAVVFWDSPTTFIVPTTAGYQRCALDGSCQDLHLPLDIVVGRNIGT